MMPAGKNSRRFFSDLVTNPGPMSIYQRREEGGMRMEPVDEIYQQYADEVKRFLVCLTGDPDLAEELTQETFYQAIRSIRRYNGACKLSVWLCQIAKHLYYDRLKRQRRHPTLSMEELEQAAPENDGMPEISLLRRDAYVSIHKAIHSLREPYREIFLLRALSELSFREIGEIFGRTENWARVTYYRAKVMLAERLEE